MDEAVRNLKRAVLEYENDGADWCADNIAQCQELLGAVQAGTSHELLEKWKVQSLQNLGFKKLLSGTAKAGKKPPPIPESASRIPPVIPTGNFRTAAAFSREIVRPAIDVMMERTMPDFRMVEVRGSESFFMRPGTAGLFDFVIFSRDWSGAMSVELASHYDSNWRGIKHRKLGCSTGLVNLRLGLAEYQLNSSHASSLQRWYRYGRSEEELYGQVLLARNHLAQYSPAFFTAARQTMQSNKMVQFGLRQVTANPLTETERSALKKELTVALCNLEKPATNRRFLELREKLERFAVDEPGPRLNSETSASTRQQSDIPQEIRNHAYALAEELLLANLAPDPGPR